MSTTYGPGKYRAEITGCQLGMSSKNNPQVVISFRPLGRVNEADPEGELVPAEADFERSMFWALTDNAVTFTVEKLQRIGYDKESFDYLDAEHPDHISFAGQEITVTCKHETWEGKTREKWDLAREGGGGLKVEAVDKGGLKKLNALFGKHLKKKPGGNGGQEAGGVATRPAPSGPTAAQQSADDFNERF